MAQGEGNAAGRIVATLRSRVPAAAIEAGLVGYFIESQRIRDVQNDIVAGLADDRHGERTFAALKAKHLRIDLADLVLLFDLLLAPADRRRMGMVSTPSPIAEFIVRQTITGAGTVCDCACGSGAFLLEALERLETLQSASAIEIIENQLYGVDIHDDSVRRAKTLLALHAILRGEDQQRIAFNLAVADSLDADWHGLFPRPFSDGGFDYVVGNPPYVRIQEIAPSARQRLAERWQTIAGGSFNLCFAFFELGRSILKPHGRLGFITPNTLLSSLAAEPLRRYLHATGEIERIVTFHDRRVFERARTYTCMVFLEKGRLSRSLLYAAAESLEALAGTGPSTSRYAYSWLDDRKWRLMTGDDYRSVGRIERAGVQLGELAAIRVGFATLRDDVFVVAESDRGECIAEFDGVAYPIERAITRPAVRICDIGGEQDLASNTRRVIFPYTRGERGFRIISEDRLSAAYPLVHAYLLRARAALAGRDKGKNDYPVWYAWGRSQSMDPKGPRLYTKTFAKKPQFIFDPGDGDPLYCNGYAVFPKEGPAFDHIRGLQRILNSAVMAHYTQLTSYGIQGGYLCYQKNFIERFGIPRLSEREWRLLEEDDDPQTTERWLLAKYGL